MKFIAPLLIGATLVTGATAATVVQDVTHNVTSTGTSYAFSKFDQRLGTLNSVTFTIVSSDDSGSFNVTNNAATAATVKSPIDRLLVYDNLTSGTDVSYNGSYLGFTTSPSTSGAGNTLAAGQSRTYTLVGNSLIGGTAQGFDLTPVLDSYQDSDGSGTVSFTAENAPSATVTGGNFSLDSSLWANSTTLRMTYDYTVAPTPPPAVPEPSVAMLGGLGALALLRRRRN
jgi:MYXO-CTERM domain-containing protein